MDPSPPKRSQLVRTHLAMGQNRKALAEAKDAADSDGGRVTVARAYLDALVWTGDLAGAQKLLSDPGIAEMVDPAADSQPLRLLLAALGSGAARDRQAFIEACARASDLTSVGERHCLLGYAALGEANAAFALMEKVLPDQRGATPQERDEKWLAAPDSWSYLLVVFWPQFRALREDTRMDDVFTRVGLIDYWKASGKRPDFCAEQKAVCERLLGGTK